MRLFLQRGIVGLLFCALSLGLTVPLIGQSVPAFLRRCPYDVATWPSPVSNTQTCPPAFRPPGLGSPIPCPPGYRYKPQQDCCGALPICDLLTSVFSVNDSRGDTLGFNANICGAGCVPNEWPPEGSGTCFVYNREQQVSHYIFEVKPLPGGLRDFGAPAGYLRFRIFPCDLPPNPATCDANETAVRCNCDTINPYNYCNDNGNTNIGLTDYDWLLFKINRYRSRRQACASISAGPADPLYNPPVSSNWSGRPGPTGMFDPGLLSCTPANNQPRYNAPIPVYVGDRFVLGINAFTDGSIKGYRIDFGGACQELNTERPTANIGPTPLGSQITSVKEDTNYCARGNFLFSLDYAFLADSITQPRKFAVRNIDRPTQSHEVVDVVSQTMADTSRLFSINFFPATPGSRYRLYYKDTLRSICGNRFIYDSIDFNIKPFITAKKSSDTAICTGGSNGIRLSAALDKIRRGFPERRDTNIIRYRWKLVKYRNEGFPATPDSIYPGYKFGSIRILGAQPGLSYVGTSAGIKGQWERTSTIAVIDTADEISAGTNLLNYRIRCITKFPSDPESENYLSTGCEDSVEYDIQFKPRLTGTITGNDSTCLQGESLVLTAATPREGRRFAWYEFQDAASTENIGFITDSSRFTVPKRPGTRYFRAVISDNTGGTSCTTVVPDFDSPAFTTRTAPNLIPKFEIKGLPSPDGGQTQLFEFSNLSYELRGQQVLPIVDETATFFWDFNDGRNVQTSRSLSEKFIVGYKDLLQGKDTLDIPVSLVVIDDITAKIGSPSACINRKDSALTLRNFFYPNAILPDDGDPRNDFLRFRDNDLGYQLEVFNRWGNLVYQSTDYKNDWKGEGSPAGVYYYTVVNRQTKETIKGWLQIIR